MCVGFNIVARIADALGFKVPSDELFRRAARLLRLFGYRRLSGYWTSGSSNGAIDAQRALDTDPYANKMERLRHSVVAGPGSLAPNVRRAISEGCYGSSPLGAFARKVAEQAFAVNDEDIQELHRANYSDDQIFEAAVSAALGAGLSRLNCVLSQLRANQPAASVSTSLTSPFQDHFGMRKPAGTSSAELW